MKSEAMQVLTIRLTDDQRSSLQAISGEEGVSLSEVIRSALSEFIERYLLSKVKDDQPPFFVPLRELVFEA